MLNTKRRITYYQAVIWISLFISVLVLIYISPILIKPQYILVDDFSQFWAAGKLNITGGNPYSQKEITQVIVDIGGKITNSDVVSIMLNPPWTLTLIMPFTLIDYPVSRLLWLLLNIAFVMISTKLLWDIYEGNEEYRKKALFLIFLFSPTLSAIQKGQFTPIILLGLTLALYNIKKHDNFWAAGVFLALVSIKPQLIYLIWIALILWTLEKNKWQLIASTLSVIAILTIIPIIVNPKLLGQYFQAMGEYPFSAWATPTIGSSLRLIFGLEKFWLQFLPMALGSIVYIIFWLKHRNNWSWVAASPMIVAISLLTTAYAWTYDGLLFIIPIIHGSIYAITHCRKKNQMIIFAGLLIISLLNIGLHTRLNDFWFMWLFPSLFIWYLLSINGYAKTEMNVSYE